MKTRTTYTICIRYSDRFEKIFETHEMEEAYEQYKIIKNEIIEFDVVLLEEEWHRVNTTPLLCQ